MSLSAPWCLPSTGCQPGSTRVVFLPWTIALGRRPNNVGHRSHFSVLCCKCCAEEGGVVVDREALKASGLGYCSTCKTICKLGDMVSEPSRKHRRSCKACHAQRMSGRIREKARQCAADWKQRGGPALLSAPLVPPIGLPINPKLDDILAVKA